MHGEFIQTSHDHLKGIGCPKCGIIKRSFVRKLGIKKFIEKSNVIHSKKYNYSDVNYINNYTKIEIICKEHGPFLQTPNSHLSGNGCSKCSNTISYQETQFLDYLNIPNTKKIDKLKF